MVTVKLRLRVVVLGWLHLTMHRTYRAVVIGPLLSGYWTPIGLS